MFYLNVNEQESLNQKKKKKSVFKLQKQHSA